MIPFGVTDVVVVVVWQILRCLRLYLVFESSRARFLRALRHTESATAASIASVQTDSDVDHRHEEHVALLQHPSTSATSSAAQFMSVTQVKRILRRNASFSEKSLTWALLVSTLLYVGTLSFLFSVLSDFEGWRWPAFVTLESKATEVEDACSCALSMRTVAITATSIC